MTMPDERNDVSRETVAAEVRAALGRARRSARSAALELGWTQPYMSRRLNGEQAFDVDDLAAIAGLLGVTVTSFFQVPAFTPRLVGQLRKHLLPLPAAA